MNSPLFTGFKKNVQIQNWQIPQLALTKGGNGFSPPWEVPPFPSNRTVRSILLGHPVQTLRRCDLF
jgi:hypothetical protein